MAFLIIITNQKFLNSHLERRYSIPWFTESAIIENLILDVYITTSLIFWYVEIKHWKRVKG